MKRMVKRGVGHFRVLADHSLRPYEPSPEHILRRMIIPLCEDVRLILEKGTRNDSWDLLKGVSKECSRILESGRTPLKGNVASR